jgi:hypothetical protein
MGESLNQPFRVKEEGLTGCKLLFCKKNSPDVSGYDGIIGISIG